MNFHQSCQGDTPLSQIQVPQAKKSNSKFSCSKNLSDVLRTLKPIKVDLSQHDNLLLNDSEMESQSKPNRGLSRFINPVAKNQAQRKVKPTKKREKENTF